MLDFFLLCEEVLSELHNQGTVLQLYIRKLCLRLLAKLLFQLLDAPLMLSPQLIHLPALGNQLRTQLVLLLSINLILLA